MSKQASIVLQRMQASMHASKEKRADLCNESLVINGVFGVVTGAQDVLGCCWVADHQEAAGRSCMHQAVIQAGSQCQWQRLPMPMAKATNANGKGSPLAKAPLWQRQRLPMPMAKAEKEVDTS